MKKQNYGNHVKFYYPHHFIFYPLALFITIFCACKAYANADERLVWLAITLAFIFIIWIAFMLRQHYGLMNQDRIVRLEMRLRYYQLTHERFEIKVEPKISFAQLAALRFASDEELVALIEKTLASNLSSKEIKKSIKNWLPDEMRV